MLAAVENEAPPADTADEAGRDRARAGAGDPAELGRARPGRVSPAGSRPIPRAALALIESKAKADPKGPYRRMLVDVLREQREYEKADKLLRELVQESPDEVESRRRAGAGRLARGGRGRRGGQRRAAAGARREGQHDDRRIPQALSRRTSTFLKAECDLVARGGDWTRAIAITQEIDKVAKSSGTGALIRARHLRPAGQAARGRQGLRRMPSRRIPASPTSASCWRRSWSSWASTTRRSSRPGSSSTPTRTGSTPCCGGPGPRRVGCQRLGDVKPPARRPSSGSRRRSPSSRAFVEAYHALADIEPGGDAGPRRSRPTGAT